MHLKLINSFNEKNCPYKRKNKKLAKNGDLVKVGKKNTLFILHKYIKKQTPPPKKQKKWSWVQLLQISVHVVADGKAAFGAYFEDS